MLYHFVLCCTMLYYCVLVMRDVSGDTLRCNGFKQISMAVAVLCRTALCRTMHVSHTVCEALLQFGQAVSSEQHATTQRFSYGSNASSTVTHMAWRSSRVWKVGFMLQLGTLCSKGDPSIKPLVSNFTGVGVLHGRASRWGHGGCKGHAKCPGQGTLTHNGAMVAGWRLSENLAEMATYWF